MGFIPWSIWDKATNNPLKYWDKGCTWDLYYIAPWLIWKYGDMDPRLGCGCGAMNKRCLARNVSESPYCLRSRRLEMAQWGCEVFQSVSVPYWNSVGTRSRTLTSPPTTSRSPIQPHSLLTHSRHFSGIMFLWLPCNGYLGEWESSIEHVYYCQLIQNIRSLICVESYIRKLSTRVMRRTQLELPIGWLTDYITLGMYSPYWTVQR